MNKYLRKSIEELAERVRAQEEASCDGGLGSANWSGMMDVIHELESIIREFDENDEDWY